MDEFVESRHVHVARHDSRVILTLQRAWSDFAWVSLALVTALLLQVYIERRIYWRLELAFLVFVASLIGWRKFYRETIELTPNHFSHTAGRTGPTWEFGLHEVANFRRPAGWSLRPFLAVPPRISLLFDVDSSFWGKDTRYIAVPLDDDEFLKLSRAYGRIKRQSELSLRARAPHRSRPTIATTQRTVIRRDPCRRNCGVTVALRAHGARGGT